MFSNGALVWVDAIVWAIAAGWTMLAALSAVVVLDADDPGLPLLLFLVLVAGAALGLVVVVQNGRAKAVRFSTLEAMCRVLKCQPGDLLEFVEE
ncbi:helix-turn-helix domain-containing protein [Pseudarthrobacter sp. NPDC092200]|uniref:helix-turn-helix domain-containing protein n=1 Tax=unclassified Pseudarthrobacter TaxID=2647000 RepID=UPI00381A7FF1